jgi:hypothetical protein
MRPGRIDIPCRRPSRGPWRQPCGTPLRLQQCPSLRERNLRNGEKRQGSIPRTLQVPLRRRCNVRTSCIKASSTRATVLAASEENVSVRHRRAPAASMFLQLANKRVLAATACSHCTDYCISAMDGMLVRTILRFRMCHSTMKSQSCGSSRMHIRHVAFSSSVSSLPPGLCELQ